MTTVRDLSVVVLYIYLSTVIILGMGLDNGRRRYFVTPSLIAKPIHRMILVPDYVNGQKKESDLKKKCNLTIIPPITYWPKQNESHSKWPILNIISIYSYCALDRPVFEQSKILLHLNLALWWSFLCDNGAARNPAAPSTPEQYCGNPVDGNV